MEELTFKVDVLMGRSECRSWLDAEMVPGGQLRLVGMGSRTDFDREGNITAHKCEATGVVMYWPAPESAPWWKRLFAYTKN